MTPIIGKDGVGGSIPLDGTIFPLFSDAYLDAVSSIGREQQENVAVFVGIPHTPSFAASYVYFIQAESGPVKIGFAISPAVRLSALQTGSHELLRIAALIPGGREMERGLHDRFADYHLRREWYRPGPEILALIERHKDEPVPPAYTSMMPLSNAGVSAKWLE